MGRIEKHYENVIIARGVDEVFGEFVLVQDRRFASTQTDIQGEGYVLDWDDFLGFSANRINAKPEDLKSDEKLVALTNQWYRIKFEAQLEDEPIEMTEPTHPIENDYWNGELEYPQ